MKKIKKMPSSASTNNTNQNLMAERVAEKVINSLDKNSHVKNFRKNHALTAITGAAGLALFLVGVEKIFGSLSGWTSVILGFLLLSISGTLWSKL